MEVPKNLKEHYVADKPVASQDEDRFQRYGFAKRIADTIMRRANEESIVFGLFGAWGEGKSSVLNFIDRELSGKEGVIVVHFNPWRYGDEDQLLYNFFKRVASALGEELESKKEKATKFVTKYATGVKAFGFDVGAVAKNIGEVDLETFKDRVTDFLNEAQTKLVMFIDDIDRLDKKEIYSLFRLVKLTADFANTCYVLSFDEDMVAAAIGEKFGYGDKDAGKNFLEKIIQIPLSLPKAQPGALKKFCFTLVENALNSNQIELTEKDVERFVYQFTSHLLTRLDTPRLAVRYGNALSFALPLLYGNVHTSDLLLIEAIKIFYPDLYAFIKANPKYFIGPYSDEVNGRNNQLTEEVKQLLGELFKAYSLVERISIIELLCDLFPVLNGVYHNYAYGDHHYRQWINDRRIGSGKYFERYFSYTVISGDVSDIEFDEMIRNLTLVPLEQTVAAIEQILSTADIANLILKLRTREYLLPWEESKRISEVVCRVDDKLTKTEGVLSFGFETTQGQAAILIYQLLKKHKNEDIFSLAKEMMTLPKDFSFAYWINYWLRSGENEPDKLFKTDQYDELAQLLIDRALAESKDSNLFEQFPDQLHFLIPSWRSLNLPALQAYVILFFNQKDENVLIFLKSLLPVTRVSGVKKEFKSDLNQTYYDFFKTLIDKEELKTYILKNFTFDEISAGNPSWSEYGYSEFSDLNMVRQFMNFYNKDISNE